MEGVSLPQLQFFWALPPTSVSILASRTRRVRLLRISAGMGGLAFLSNSRELLAFDLCGA